MAPESDCESKSETDGEDAEPPRFAHYCANCQMTVRVFTTEDGPEVGCHSTCHRFPIEAFVNGDLPEDWRLENSPFEW